MFTVLVVEDDPNLRELFSLMLTMEGYTIVVASDGEEAIATLNENRPDVLILDMNLPVISGFEVMRYIRNHETLNNLRVIIVSANSNAPSSDEAELADVVLMKPVTMVQLQTMVRRMTGAGTKPLIPKEDDSEVVNANDSDKKPATGAGQAV